MAQVGEICPSCQSYALKLRPAGVGRTSGKPYGAAIVCSDRNCPFIQWLEPRAPRTPQAAPRPVQQRTPAPQTNGAGEARLRAATAAWAAACKFYEVNERTGPELDALAVRGYQWIMRCHAGQPTQAAPVQQREPGEDDDINF